MPKYTILYLHETAQVSGAENSLFNLVNKIDRERFNPVFACPCPGPFPEKLAAAGIKVFPVSFPAVRLILGVWPTVNKIQQIIKGREVKLIHSNSIRTHIYASLLGRLNRIPVIWHQRNLITNEIIDPDRLFSFLPDKIICNSNAVAKRFLKRGRLSDKVQVVFNGVDTEKFNPAINADTLKEELGIAREEIVVGITSRFNLSKGHEAFFRAAKSILCDLPGVKKNLKFLVVGGAVFAEDQSREAYLRGRVEALGIKDKVVFTGFRQDMPEVYASMNIFVIVSFAEACGRVVLEAMASGKPIVATNSGGNPEMIQDGVNGFLVEPGNPGALAERIAVLVNNSMLAKQMGEAGRKMAQENFRIEKNVEHTEKIYLQLIRE
jgi:glycosyltransferase involved in cell wall biosynthesis